MKLIVGLGNPGPKHAGDRHNIGWMAADAVAGAHGFGPFRSKFQGQLAEGRLGAEKVLILKPETYMNLSGQSVGAALRFHKLAAEDVIVLHDELDLAPGKLRIKSGGGHAGHNGLRSLHQHVGPEFHRVRLGIGHPGHKDRVSGYVLSPFAKADRDWLDPLLEAVAEAAPKLAEGDFAGFQNAVALRTAPPKPARAAPKPKDAPAPSEPPAPASALERLIARFNRR